MGPKLIARGKLSLGPVNYREISYDRKIEIDYMTNHNSGTRTNRGTKIVYGTKIKHENLGFRDPERMCNPENGPEPHKMYE